MSSSYDFMGKAWRGRRQYVEQMMRQLAVGWRRDPAILRVEHPTRLDRARRVGYKAKQGFVVIRARIRRSGARKKRPVSGRRPKTMGVTKFKWAKSMKQIAEERVARKHPNLEILNSYFLWADGKYYWTEVLMIDPNHPVIASDSRTKWIARIEN